MLIPASGGFFPDSWYPSAIGAWTLLLITALASRRWWPSARAARVALAAFAALVAFNYLSIAWAAGKGEALDGANQLVLYLAVAWIFAILPWTPRALAVMLGAWSLAVTAYVAIGLIQATGSTHLGTFFDQLRYATPLHYPNATPALSVMGMWPALALSARREVPVWIKPLFLAVAVFLGEFTLLPQSRGALLGLAVSALVVAVICRDRLQIISRMLVVGAGIVAVAPKTVAVDTAANGNGHVSIPLAHAATVMLWTSLAAIVVAVALAYLEAAVASRWKPRLRPWRPARRLRIAAAVIAALAIFTGVGVASPRIGHLARTVLKQGHSDADTGSVRLLSTTPEERVDYVRVAFHVFSSHPILGVGAGNYARQYDGLRRFQKHSQNPHDLALRALSETGIIGFGLLLVLVISLAVGVIRVARRHTGVAAACAVGVLGLATYFLVHDSLDWLDEFPVLAGPALGFCLATIVMGDVRRRAGGSPRPSSARFRLAGPLPRSPVLARAALAAAVVIAELAVCVVLGAPYIANRYVQRAFATFRQRPTQAYRDLSRAGSLNPLSADPFLSDGTIALTRGEEGRARTAFVRSLGREQNWYSHFELALLDAHAGHAQAALSELSITSRLDADDPVVDDTRSAIERGRQIDPVQFNQLFLQNPLFERSGLY